MEVCGFNSGQETLCPLYRGRVGYRAGLLGFGESRPHRNPIPGPLNL
jgi:hypothetical protein